jgi:ATP-binding cassette, subfamily G (WHITE), member 2, SNQ2
VSLLEYISGCVDTNHHRNNLGPNQACTLFGAQSGSNIITGSNYLSVGYGINVGDLWRHNFLVLLGFFIAFQVTQLIALEVFPVRIS